MQVAEYLQLPVITTYMAHRRHPGQPPAARRAYRHPGRLALRQPLLPGLRPGAGHRQPLHRPPHRQARRLHQGPPLHPHQRRARRTSGASCPPSWASWPTPGWRCEALLAEAKQRARRARAQRARRAHPAGPRGAGAQDRLRPGADQAAARLPGDERVLRRRAPSLPPAAA